MLFQCAIYIELRFNVAKLNKTTYPPPMAIEFARTNIISRGNGQSVVKAAAYRAGERLFDERMNRSSDYSFREEDVVHSQILLPEGADESFLDRQTLWNAVEDREDRHNRRATAQLAKDHIIALPRELSKAQQIAMAEGFARSQFVQKGLVVDLNVHFHSTDNPHAHLLTTTRKLVGTQFGLKAREENGGFYSAGLKVTDAEQIRHAWAEYQNEYFRDNDIDLNVTNNDGSIEPELHLGPAKGIDRRGIDSNLVLSNGEKIQGRTAALYSNPEMIIERVVDRKSVFTRHDLYRELHQLVDDKSAFIAIKNRLENHTGLISLGVLGGQEERFTSKSVVAMEQQIAELCTSLASKNSRFLVPEKLITAALEKQSFLGEEQRFAVKHTLQNNRIASVIGLAGAGKSSMLSSMREASENAGHTVFGIALAGKAAEELTKSSGIESRTIAAFLRGVGAGKLQVGKGDIIVMDEAGMVNNKTMLSVLEVINKAGAKLVMVGDDEQLQPIQAGTPFKSIAENQGAARIETIRRQRLDWQKQATFDLAKGRSATALKAYEDAGFVHRMPSIDVVDRLVSDYVNARGDGSQAILAHRNSDVKRINDAVRDRLKKDGILAEGRLFIAGQASTNAGIPLGTRVGDTLIFEQSNNAMGYESSDRATYMGEQNGLHTLELDNGGELTFDADNSPLLRLELDERVRELELSPGDRVLFTRNNAEMGVKNGMLGTLESYVSDTLAVKLDDGSRVVFNRSEYASIEHGYATTIHKSQGMTVDNAYLFGSNSMDKHLGYVGLSRHRDSVHVYLANEDFEHQDFGSLLLRSNQQNSVLDIAEREGLDFDEIDVGRTEFVDSPPNNAGEGGSTMAQFVEQTVIEESLSTIEAQQTLESTRLSLVDRMQNEAREGIKVAERQSRIADRALDGHRAIEPKVGRFSNKDKHQQWEATLESLQKTSLETKKTVSNLKTELDSSQEKFSRQARKEAAIKHPEAAEIVRTAKDNERVSAHYQKIKSVEKEITHLEISDGPRSKIDNLHNKLDRAIKDLAADKGSYSKLSSEQRREVEKTSQKLAQQKQAREMEERGRGGIER